MQEFIEGFTEEIEKSAGSLNTFSSPDFKRAWDYAKARLPATVLPLAGSVLAVGMLRNMDPVKASLIGGSVGSAIHGGFAIGSEFGKR